MTLLMSDQTPEATKLQRAENFLRGQIVALEADQKRNELERQRVETERARIDLELAKTKGALAELVADNAPAIPLPQREQETFEAEAPKKGDFAGLELTDAIYEYLLMLQRHLHQADNQKARRHGWPFTRRARRLNRCGN
jgi:hypothetical protein